MQQEKFFCKAQYIGIGHFVRCTDDDPSQCSFAVQLGSAYLCQSPLLNSRDNVSLRAAQENHNSNHAAEYHISGNSFQEQRIE